MPPQHEIRSKKVRIAYYLAVKSRQSPGTPFSW